MSNPKRRNQLQLIVPVVVAVVVVVLFVLIPNFRSSGARPVVGEPMRDFTVVDSQGVRFQLSEEAAEGPVVLIFYRGFWCGICQNQLQDLEQHRPQIEELGAQLVAISTDSTTFAERARVDLGLGYRVVPDDKLKLLRMFDHSEIYSDSDVFNPAIYIIDEAGVVRWAYFGEHAADRPSSEMVYNALVEIVNANVGVAAQTDAAVL